MVKRFYPDEYFLTPSAEVRFSSAGTNISNSNINNLVMAMETINASDNKELFMMLSMAIGAGILLYLLFRQKKKGEQMVKGYLAYNFPNPHQKKDIAAGDRNSV